MDPLQLPTPSATELDRSEKLITTIRDQIGANGGAIDFSRYMELALYTPGLGYYSAPQQKFGETGDFTTAPEISPLFATCIANQCAPVLHQLGSADVLEAGAGSGIMATGILQQLERLNALPRQYFIIELSAELRQRQQQTLAKQTPHLINRVRWLDTLPDAGFRGIILANELLDAMPVQLFRVIDNSIKQLAVAWRQNKFTLIETPASDAIIQRIKPLALPNEYTSEINLNAEAWIKTISDSLDQGMVLIVDYGYPQRELYLPERMQGTLLCHYRHRAHDDPFRFVGLQDITSHINFSALAEAAYSSGLSVLGYTSQAAFLLATGLTEIVEASDPENVRQHLTMTNQVKKLTLPTEMGELFKAIAFGKDVAEPLMGFTLQDRRGRL